MTEIAREPKIAFINDILERTLRYTPPFRYDRMSDEQIVTLTTAAHVLGTLDLLFKELKQGGTEETLDTIELTFFTAEEGESFLQNVVRLTAKGMEQWATEMVISNAKAQGVLK